MVRVHRRGRRAVGFLSKLFGGSPPEPPAPEGDVARIAEVEAVLTEVRPLLIADGGDVRILRIEADGSVELQFIGACASCFQSPTTLAGVLKPKLRESLDWVTDVTVH